MGELKTGEIDATGWENRLTPSAPVKAGSMQWMEVAHGEGLAIHAVSESCGGLREEAADALTGVRSGSGYSVPKESRSVG